MGIGAVGGRQGVGAQDVDEAEAEAEALAPPAPPSRATTSSAVTNSVASLGGLLGGIARSFAAPTVGALIGGTPGGGMEGAGPTSKEQALTFDFFAILGNIARDVAGALLAKPVPPSNQKDGADAQHGKQTSFGTTTLRSESSTSAEADASWTPGRAIARAEADAHLLAEARASGAASGALGDIAGEAHASAELYARASAYAEANSRGVTTGATAQTGAYLEAGAEMDTNLLAGLVTGHAEVEAQSGSGADVSVSTTLSCAPPEAAVTAKAGAFAGARAGFQAKGGLAGISYGVEAEVRAGIGIEAEATLGLRDGKLTFEYGLGICLGVGAFIKPRFELDLHSLGPVLGGIVAGIANLLGADQGPAHLPGQHAGDIIDEVLDSTRGEPTFA